MSKETNIAELNRNIERLSFIVDELEPNEGYKKLVEYFREECKALDDTWQFIDECDTNKRMEARATKMAYSHIFNILEYLKADIVNTKRIVAELEETQSQE